MNIPFDDGDRGEPTGCPMADWVIVGPLQQPDEKAHRVKWNSGNPLVPRLQRGRHGIGDPARARR